MVARHLQLDVLFKRAVVAEVIHGDGVVDNQIDRRERIDLRYVAAEALHRFAHRCQIHDCRHAGKILHQHARRTVGNLSIGMGILLPANQRLNILFRHGIAILPAQKILQQHF